MLNLANKLSKDVIKGLNICTVITKRTSEKNEIKKTVTNLKIAMVRAGADAFVVGGIAFFGSLIALGFSDVLDSVKISFVSSLTTAGLAFFNEMREQLKSKK